MEVLTLTFSGDKCKYSKNIFDASLVPWKIINAYFLKAIKLVIRSLNNWYNQSINVSYLYKDAENDYSHRK